VHVSVIIPMLKDVVD